MTGSLGSLAAITLAFVFGFAAVTKLRNPSRTRTEFRQLGLPGPTAAARLIPAVELAVAAGLVFRPRLGGLAAALLLCGFTAVVIAVIRSGRTVSCGCFGAMSQEPISHWTVARNGALLLTAALASSIDTVTAPDPAVVMVCGSTLLLGALAAQLLVLRHRVGPLWQVTLAGEAAADATGSPDAIDPADADGSAAVVLDLQIDLDHQVERLVQDTSGHRTTSDHGHHPPTRQGTT